MASGDKAGTRRAESDNVLPRSAPMTDAGLHFTGREQKLRKAMAAELPRVPNDAPSYAAFMLQPTRAIMLAFLTWRRRNVPARPRRVVYWARGVRESRALAERAILEPFQRKVEAGEDLTPYLSDLVRTKGVVLPGANPNDIGKDLDRVLIREGLHHFHVGKVTPANPRGRSFQLIFAEVLEDEFRVVAIASHAVFDAGSPDHMSFFELCRAYIARDIPAGQAFMANPVMSSGHSLATTLYADRCEETLQRTDPRLDDPAFVDELYRGEMANGNSASSLRPAKPLLEWRFEHLDFGIFDRRTRTFFRFFYGC